MKTATDMLAERERFLNEARRQEMQQREIAAHLASGPDSWRTEFPTPA